MVPKAEFLSFFAAFVVVATSAISQTSGNAEGTIDGNELNLTISCKWTDDETLEIKSHDFMMLAPGFEEEPALHMSFYNNSYFLVVLAAGDAYRMVDQDPGGGLKPSEVFHHVGTVPQQAGRDGDYDFDLVIHCPR